MRLIQATTLALIAAIGAVAACASSGPKTPCAIAPLDSVYVGLAPVYEDCAVDRQAKLVVTRDDALQYRPTRTPDGASGCIFADARFVVDTLGHPELGTARIVRTNDQDLADFVVANIGRLRYEPAQIAGKPVRQIVTEHRGMGFVKAVVTKGSAPPRPVGPFPKC